MQLNQNLTDWQEDQAPLYLGDVFDRRTLLEMELAVSKACETLPISLDGYDSRRLVATRIIKRVESGERTFGGMVTAGLSVVSELNGEHTEINDRPR